MHFRKGHKVIANKNFTSGRFTILAGRNGVITNIGEFTGAIIVRWDKDTQCICKMDDLTLKFENVKEC